MSSPIRTLTNERSFHASEALSAPEQLKVYLEAACRRMSTEEVLDLADHLHELIRERRTHRRTGHARAFC